MYMEFCLAVNMLLYCLGLQNTLVRNRKASVLVLLALTGHLRSG